MASTTQTSQQQFSKCSSARLYLILPAKTTNISISCDYLMGSAASTKRALSEYDDLMRLFEYEVHDTPTDNDLTTITTIWTMILNDKLPSYLQNKESLKVNSCLDWFYNIFSDINVDLYEYFADGAKMNKKMLQKMIQDGLDCYTSATYADRRRKFSRLAIFAHHKYKMRSFQYPLLGNVIMKSLSKCLGEKMYQQCHEAFARLFSSILHELLPPLLICEKRSITKLNDRFHFQEDRMISLLSE